MITNKMRRVLSLAFLGLGLSLLLGIASYAQESGLGYSEAPFTLINNATEAQGDTPLEAIQASSADAGEITEETVVEQGDYALSTVIFNYIGVSAVTKQVDNNWQFVCRAGGLMQPEELIERCGIPAATAETLYANFLEALSSNE
ncbi:MAG: hypothetical protein AAF171_03175 [Cyanobacteria bacterium P01_A01_bin.116]